MISTRTRPEKVFNVFNIFVLSLFSLITLYPFINIAAIAFNDGIDTMLGGITFYPRVFTLENIKVALSYPAIKESILVSVGRTIIGTVYHVLFIAMAAYALSKKDLILRKYLLIYFILPGFMQPGLVPQFVNIAKLGLLNNFWVYILPFVANFYHLIILRTFIEKLPSSLEESAYIDGANHLVIFIKIIIPLSLPAIAAVSLFHAVFLWNDWFTTMIYVTDKNLFTLQYVLQRVLKENMAEEVMSYADFMEQEETIKRITPTSIQMAILIIATFPILVVYPFLQKYFVKGVMIGAVKG